MQLLCQLARRLRVRAAFLAAVERPRDPLVLAAFLAAVDLEPAVRLRALKRACFDNEACEAAE